MSAKSAPLISPDELTKPFSVRQGLAGVDTEGLRRELERQVDGEVLSLIHI